MKSIVVTKFGPPGVLKIEHRPLPEPAADEARVQVKAIGLNFADVMARLGVYPSIPSPPFVPGIEFSGVVEKVGRSVSSPHVGAHVAGFTKQGAYSEFICARPETLMELPDALSFEEAASIGVTYLTAYHGMITLSNIQRGERMLLHAAAGGVGTAALQLAKHLSVEVIATAGSDEKIKLARTLGAAHAINYTEEDFSERVRALSNGYGVDVVMDSVGGSLIRRGWNLLAPMGRYILFGFASVTGRSRINRLRAVKEILAVPLLYPPNIVSKNRMFAGFNLYFLSHKTEYFKRAFENILEWRAAGIVKPVIGRVFAFDQMAEAHAVLQSRQSIGKVVVQVS
ncbi:MAG: zinc-binding dehydrogenase [Ignavibacteriales bacterium]|nr:zinc-binding dehydrogenase [Ignavibacteriales bacterium]